MSSFSVEKERESNCVGHTQQTLVKERMFIFSPTCCFWGWEDDLSLLPCLISKSSSRWFSFELHPLESLRECLFSSLYREMREGEESERCPSASSSQDDTCVCDVMCLERLVKSMSLCACIPFLFLSLSSWVVLQQVSSLSLLVVGLWNEWECFLCVVLFRWAAPIHSTDRRREERRKKLTVVKLLSLSLSFSSGQG